MKPRERFRNIKQRLITQWLFPPKESLLKRSGKVCIKLHRHSKTNYRFTSSREFEIIHLKLQFSGDAETQNAPVLDTTSEQPKKKKKKKEKDSEAQPTQESVPVPEVVTESGDGEQPKKKKKKNKEKDKAELVNGAGPDTTAEETEEPKKKKKKKDKSE